MVAARSCQFSYPLSLRGQVGRLEVLIVVIHSPVVMDDHGGSLTDGRKGLRDSRCVQDAVEWGWRNLSGRVTA